MLLGMPFLPLLLALGFALLCAALTAAMVKLPDIPQPVAGDPADRRAAETLISLLLAPDVAGNLQALARRMGIEELIWDCGYWGAGMTQVLALPALLLEERQAAQARRQDDRAPRSRSHRDEQGGGRRADELLEPRAMRAGAAGRTSFWSRGR
jgi:hypothetical protein